jgi:hypothetical protein
VQQAKAEVDTAQTAGVEMISRRELQHCPPWQWAFVSQHKDSRYYEIVEDTIHPEFQYLYFAVRNCDGVIRAVQPSFILDQDLLAGVRVYCGGLIDAIRGHWPRFMVTKTMMIGCVAGEAHLDDGSDATRAADAEVLAAGIGKHARALGVQLVVLKEFPASYRDVLSCFVRLGFTRVPSMPLARLNIAYGSFEEYTQKALNSATRAKLRKKFRAAELDAPIELSVSSDIGPVIDEVYPLYVQVYERSKLHFEKLTKEYFCRLGRAMPDKVRFFVWRRNGKAVAFGECLVHGDTMFAEYLGL